MLADPWLQRWLPLLREQAADTPVLEIGCGAGEDTATLTAAGLAVTAFDISADASPRRGSAYRRRTSAARTCASRSRSARALLAPWWRA